MKQYKIYTKGNYIVIVDVQRNEYFYGIRKEVHIDKSNVDKAVYKAFNVKDFSSSIILAVPNILKENGDAYSEAEFDTFYQENTGNFNGGGTAPYIPLSGTTEGNPVTGDIEFIGDGEITSLIAKRSETDIVNLIFNTDENSVNLKAVSPLLEGKAEINSTVVALSQTDTFNNKLNSLRVDEIGVLISSTRDNPRGLISEQDFTANITDLDYTQKKYVDERGSVFNATTSVLSASDLNTAYPNAKDGFSVIAPNVVGGGKYYIKAGAGWVYQQILAVV